MDCNITKKRPIMVALISSPSRLHSHPTYLSMIESIGMEFPGVLFQGYDGKKSAFIAKHPSVDHRLDGSYIDARLGHWFLTRERNAHRNS